MVLLWRRRRRCWRGRCARSLARPSRRSAAARCIEAGANDYLSKPLDVDKLLSLTRVWMPR